MNQFARRASLLLIAFVTGLPSRAGAEPIPIAALDRKTPVSFEKEILPILRRSCLACHSASDASGELVLESPGTMFKGGDTGPAVVARNGAESLLLKVASYQTEPVMPPPQNDVAAPQLTSAELGLLKLWIDQGARASESGTILSPERWRPLPSGSGPIYAVAISPDGQFAACGRGNQIFIYQVATGQLITRLHDPELQQKSKDDRPGIAHLDFVQSLSFSSDGNRLASGGFRTAKIWQYPRNVQRRSLTTSVELRSVAVSPARDRIALGGNDGTIRLWSLAAPDESTPPPESLTLAGHTAAVRSLTFTASGGRLVSVGMDQSVRVWSTTDGRLAGRIDTPTELLSVTTFLQQLPAPAADQPVPDPVEMLATGGADNLIRLWKIPTELPGPFEQAPADTRKLAASSEGSLVACATKEGMVRVVDRMRGRTIHEWQAHAGMIHDLAFGIEPPATLPDGANPPEDPPPPSLRLATAGEEGTVRIWAIAAVSQEAQEAAAKPAAPATVPKEQFVLRGSLVPVQAISFRPDGKQLLAGMQNGNVTLWNLESTAAPAEVAAAGAVIPAGQAPQPAAPAEAPHLIKLSPDGKLMATTGVAGNRQAIIVRDFATGRTLRTLLGHEDEVVSLAFSRDSARVVSGSADGTARVWDLAEEKFSELARFSGHSGSVTAVAFTPDSQQVVSGSVDKSLKLWSVADSQELMDFAGHTAAIVAAAVLPNGQPVSASADRTVRVWNPGNGQPVRSQTEPAAVTAFALSPDGSRIAVAAQDHSVRIYAAGGGAAQATLTGHQQPIHSLAFSFENTRLVSGGADDLALVWDLTDGRLLELIPLPDSRNEQEQAAAGNAPLRLTAAVYSPAIDRLVLADNRGAVHRPLLRFAGACRGMTMAISGVVWHPNGQLGIAGCADGTVRGYNATNFQQAYSANHGAAIHNIALSPDGQRLASAGEDMSIRLWNPASGGQLQPARLTGFTAPVTSVCFSSDSTRVIGGTSGERGELLVFSMVPPAGLMEQSITGHTGTIESCLPIGRNGRVVSAAVDGTVLTWQLLADRSLVGHTEPVSAVAAIPPQEGQPSEILSGSLDGSVRRWNSVTGQALARLNHGAPVTGLAVRGDNQRWASTSSNNTIRLWNAANNQQIAQMQGDIRAKALVARLTRAKADATTRLNEAKAAVAAAEKDLPTKTAAEKTAADALTAAARDVTAKAAVLQQASTAKAAAEKVAIEAAAGARKAALQMQKADELAAELAEQAAELARKAALAANAAAADAQNDGLAKLAAEAAALAKSADGKAKAAVAAQAAPAKDATATAQLAAQAAKKALDLGKPFSDAATVLATSQSAERVARQKHEIAARELKTAADLVPSARATLAKAEAGLKQTDIDLTAATQAEAAAQQPVQTVAFSPDGRTLATGGDFGVIHTWDAETGEAVSSCVGHKGTITGLAFVSESEAVSVSADRQAIVWDLNPAWQLERVIGDIYSPSQLVDRVRSVDFSHDGTLLATGGGVPSRGGEVKIWKVADGELVLEIPEPHTDTVNAVAFSPDDEYIASASADKYVRKFKVSTGVLAAQFEGHTNYALSVSWRAGGKILASSGADGTIRTWNAESGDRIRSFGGFTKQVSAVRYLGQTQFAVIVSGQGLTRMYNTDNGGVQVNYGGPSDYMFSIDATGDRTTGYVVAGGYDGKLWIWRANGPTLHTIGPPVPEEIAETTPQDE